MSSESTGIITAKKSNSFVTGSSSIPKIPHPSINTQKNNIRVRSYDTQKKKFYDFNTNKNNATPKFSFDEKDKERSPTIEVAEILAKLPSVNSMTTFVTQQDYGTSLLWNKFENNFHHEVCTQLKKPKRKKKFVHRESFKSKPTFLQDFQYRNYVQ